MPTTHNRQQLSADVAKGSIQLKEEYIMPAIIMWLMGVPVTIIILLYLVF
jgi:hypothetical protein